MKVSAETLAYGAALLGVGTLLYLGYRAGTRVGDVVEVAAKDVTGLPPGPSEQTLQTLHLAVKVAAVDRGQVSGTPLGLATNSALTTPVPGGNAGFMVSFPTSAVIGKVKAPAELRGA